MRVYDFNDNYFEIIDSEEKAYWLGFLLADGCVSTTHGNRVILQISSKDEEHLKKFKASVCCKKPINFDKRGFVGITLCSSKMIKDLGRFG